MNALKPKLPPILFVRVDIKSFAPWQYKAEANKGSLVYTGETAEIGEYVLKRRIEIKGVAEELRELG